MNRIAGSRKGSRVLTLECKVTAAGKNYIVGEMCKSFHLKVYVPTFV